MIRKRIAEVIVASWNGPPGQDSLEVADAILAIVQQEEVERLKDALKRSNAMAKRWIEEDWR